MQITPLSEILGAEVTGLNLADIDDAAFAAIHDAFLTHHILVFRDQDLSPEQQAAFSRRFGPLDIHVQTKSQMPGIPEVQVLSTKVVNGKYVGSPAAGDYWHSDLSYTDIPTLCTLLHARALPEEGGDTEWSNMHLAYETLPEKTRERIAPLRARHTYNRLRNPRVTVHEAHRDEAKARYADISPDDSIHPVVRTHPKTGRKALYVSPRFTIGIEDMDEAEGQALLDELFEQSTRRAFIYRHKWRLGDLTMWDNRCLMHLACGGVPKGQLRHMNRTIVRGDVPY
ncbi:MAG: TauD/TfdA family dioxygenase [Proteobacteria bacterium]|nr:TauD/TfdA family dioxygenase [Pseudomonadota bacterium]